MRVASLLLASQALASSFDTAAIGRNLQTREPSITKVHNCMKKTISYANECIENNTKKCASRTNKYRKKCVKETKRLSEERVIQIECPLVGEQSEKHCKALLPWVNKKADCQLKKEKSLSLCTK